MNPYRTKMLEKHKMLMNLNYFPCENKLFFEGVTAFLGLDFKAFPPLTGLAFLGLAFFGLPAMTDYVVQQTMNVGDSN